MKAKLVAHGNEIFETYELLEMLLYFGISRKDTNPIAKRLLSRFGDLNSVLCADVKELATVEGVGKETAELIHSVGTLYDLLGVELGDSASKDFKSYTVAGEYLLKYFGDSTEYSVAVLLLDNGMRPLGTFTVFRDMDYANAKIEAKKIVELAISAKAATVITAHNHPFGPLFPTPEDRSTNEAVTCALDALGILHLEHFLICGSNYIGIMNHLKERFAAAAEIYEFIRSRDLAMEARDLNREADGVEI